VTVVPRAHSARQDPLAGEVHNPEGTSACLEHDYRKDNRTSDKGVHDPLGIP